MSWSVTRVAISSSILPMLWRCAAVGFGVRKGVVDRNVTVYLHGGKIRCRSRRLRLWQVRVQPKEAQQFQLGCILKIVAMTYMFWNELLSMYRDYWMKVMAALATGLLNRFGRRTAALVLLISQTVARLITAFSINFYMFVFGRLLLAVSALGWYTTFFLFGRQKNIYTYLHCKNNFAIHVQCRRNLRIRVQYTQFYCFCTQSMVQDDSMTAS